VRAVSPRLASEEPRRPSSWFSNFVDSSAASVSSYSVALLVPLPDRRTNPRDDARCDELRFLRALVLDGDFDAAASFLEPLRDADDDDAKNQNHQNRRRHASARAALGRQAFLELLDAPDASASDLARSLAELEPLLERRDFETLCYAMTLPSVAAHDDFAGWSVARGRLAAFRRVLLLTLVPIRPRRRGERRSLRTFPGVSLRPSPLGFNPDTPRRLSTPSDAFQLHPDVALNDGTTLRALEDALADVYPREEEEEEEEGASSASSSSSAMEVAMRHALAHVNLVNGTFGGGAPATSLFESVRTAERRRNANEKAAPVRRASPSGGKQRRLPVFGVRASVAVATPREREREEEEEEVLTSARARAATMTPSGAVVFSSSAVVEKRTIIDVDVETKTTTTTTAAEDGASINAPSAKTNTTERKSLRIGVHNANAVVWGPVPPPASPSSDEAERMSETSDGDPPVDDDDDEARTGEAAAEGAAERAAEAEADAEATAATPPAPVGWRPPSARPSALAAGPYASAAAATTTTTTTPAGPPREYRGNLPPTFASRGVLHADANALRVLAHCPEGFVRDGFDARRVVVACASSARALTIVATPPFPFPPHSDGSYLDDDDWDDDDRDMNGRAPRGDVLLRVENLHPAPCSIYALAWGGFDGHVIATGANDGGVCVVRLKWDDDGDGYGYEGYGTSTGAEDDDDVLGASEYGDAFLYGRSRSRSRSRRLAVVGAPAAARGGGYRGGHDGAVRSIAFFGARDGAFISGGGGDFAPRVWSVGGDAAWTRGDAPPPALTLAPHRDEIVAVATDWDQRDWFSRSACDVAATASRDGDVRVYDVRDGACARRASLRVDASGDVVGGGASRRLTAMSVRRFLVATGYSDGGVAVCDMRKATSTGSSNGSGSGVTSRTAVLWSEAPHAGSEVRSVEVDPSGTMVLTGGFDGRCRVVRADDGSYNDVTHGVTHDGHDDKVVCARWRPVTGKGEYPYGPSFASCGVDRTVRVFTQKVSSHSA